MEVWREIQGYEGIYDISSEGHIRRRGHGSYRPIQPYKGTKGYYCIRLISGRTKRYFAVHRLVAQAFIPNPEGKTQVNHIDGNKHNNTVSNLEWVTAKENAEHALSHGLRINRTMPVLCFDGIETRRFPSIKEASRATNIHYYTISLCCQGVYKRAGGMEWRYSTMPVISGRKSFRKALQSGLESMYNQFPSYAQMSL